MSNYFADYMLYSSENEASPKLHQWASIFVLSAAMSRKVWFEQGAWMIHPNMYVFLVGAPGDCKSVSMSLAQKVVHDFTNIEVGPNQITREALMVKLQKCKRQYVWNEKTVDYSPITLFANELVTLLGAEPNRMIEIFTDLYDNHTLFQNVTKNQGSDYIVAPTVTLLGCLTPSTLNNMLAQSVITGGFCRRLLLIYTPDRGSPKPLPKMHERHYEAKARCVDYCKQVQDLVGPFVMTPDAERFFDKWYREVKDVQRKEATTDVMRYWFGSKDQPLIKVAMCLAIGESLEMVIKKDHLEAALRLLDETEPDILTILGGGGRNDLAPITRAIERFIHDHFKSVGQGVSIKRIKGAFMQQANDDEIKKVLQHLYDTDSVVIEMKGEIPFYKPRQ